jgi:WD40 repeat protein
VTRDLVELVERRRPDVVAFAIPLSLAVRIDRPLARAMRERVARSADVSLETELWSSPLVQVRGTGECTLRASAAAALWERLPTTADALRAIWSFYAACHAAAPPLIRLEERLAYLARLAALELPADDARTPAPEAIDRELRTVVAAMSADETRRRDLAAWSARALARLPAAVRDSEAAKILGAAVVGWVAAPPEVTALTPSLEGASLARRLAPPSATSRRAISVRRVGPRVEVIAERRDPPWATLEIAASPFALYVDDDREVPLRRDGVTPIDIGDRDVVLGDADGRRWLVPVAHAQPDLGGIAAIIGKNGPGYAYLVAPRIAATSARLLGDAGWSGGLWFPSGQCAGRVIAFDEDADCALLELEPPPRATPVVLSTEAAVNAIWRTYGPDLGPRAPSGTPMQRGRGRVASAGPDLQIEAADGATPRPGTPIFVADLVIGHVRQAYESGAPFMEGDRVVGILRPEPRQPSSAGDSPRKPVGICAARTVAWWRVQRGGVTDARRAIVRMRVRERARQEGEDAGGWDERIGIVVGPSLVLMSLTHLFFRPPEPAFETVIPLGAGAEVRGTLVFAVNGLAGFATERPLEREPLSVSHELRDGSAVDIVDDTRTRAGSAHIDPGLPSTLLLRVPDVAWQDAYPVGSAVVAGAVLVGVVYDSSEGPRASGPLANAVTPALVEAIRSHGSPAPERRAVVNVASSFSPDGLLSMRGAVDRNGQHRRSYRTTGRQPWTIHLGPSREGQPGQVAVQIDDDMQPRVGMTGLRIIMTASNHRALGSAAGMATAALHDDARLVIDDRLQLVQLSLTSIPGLPREYAVRRALRLVTEVLVRFDAAAPPDSGSPPQAPAVLYLHIPGSGELEIATLDDGIAGQVTSRVRVLEIDPDVDLVAIVADDPAELMHAVQAHAGIDVERVYPAARPDDAWHGKFGVAEMRRGRRLSVENRGYEAELRVTSVDGHPPRGHVSFWVPAAIAASPIRVRAVGGVASCRISRRHPYDFTVGAVIEDEGLPLEATVSSTRLLVNLVRERPLAIDTGSPIWDCAVHPDGRRVVSAGGDGLLRLLEIRGERRSVSLRGHTGSVFGCAITPDGTRALSASADQSVRVWDLESHRLLLRYEGHTDHVCACAVTPDGRLVVSVGEDRAVHVWDIATGKTLHVLEGHAGRVCDCAVTFDGTRIVTASADTTLRVWDLETGRPLWVLEGHRDRVNGCAITHDNRRVVSASYDGTLKIWDLESGRLLATLEGHADKVQTCKVSPDGRWIASGSNDGTLRLWEIEHAALRATADEAHRGAVLGCAWTPDAARIVSVGEDGAVKLWTVEEGAFSGS